MSNNYQPLLLDDMPINIAIYEMTSDENFIFVDFNKQAEITENISKDKLIGKRVTDVFPGVKSLGLFDVLLRVGKTGKEELFNLGLYEDQRISGWRKNRVSRLENGLIFVSYENLEYEDDEIKTYAQQLDTKNKELDYQYGILNSVLNSTPDLIFYKDYLNHSGRYIGCNEAFEKFVGKKEKDIIGKIDIELFGENVGSFFHAEDKKILDRNITVISKEWAEYPNKGKVLLSTSKTPLKDKSHNTIGILGISRDITQDHEKAEELKNRMELALLGNSAGVYEWYMLDNSAYYSPQWMNMLGYKDNELPPQLSTWQDRVHPDDIEEIMLNVQKTIEAKQTNIEILHRLKHKDGNWIWALGRGLIRYNEQSMPYSMVGVHTDITEQRVLELQHKQQAQIIEQIHDSVISTDMEGNITSFNHGSEVLLDYKADEIIGSHISKIYLEEDSEKLNRSLEVLRRDGGSNLEFQLVKKSGEVIDANLSLSLLKDEKDNPIGMIGYAQDITERKKVEDEIFNINKNLLSIVKEEVEKNREKDKLMLQQRRLAQMGEMLNMISHQWKQPLNNLSILSQALVLKYQLNELDDTEIDYFNSNTSKQIAQMLDTINDFRSFFKPQKDKKVFNITETIGHAVGILLPIFKKENIILNLSLSENCYIYGYSNELGQGLINILNNAKDALIENDIEDKRIDITLSHDAQDIHLAVSDNAGGIPDYAIDKVFDPYFSTKNEKHGTGIGLYMCKIIIEEHMNGKISVYNKNSGASIEVTLSLYLDKI